MTDETYECPWCQEEISEDERQSAGLGNFSACKRCGGYAPDDDWDEVEEQSLTDVGGVGQSRADDLRDEGYESIEDLRDASQDELADVVGNALAARVKADVGLTDDSDEDSDDSDDDLTDAIVMGTPDSGRTFFEAATDKALDDEDIDAEAIIEEIDVDFDDIEFQNDEMAEYYGQTSNHTDDDDGSHELDSPTSMECTCGATAVHDGDTIVCTDSDEVLWESGERDETEIAAKDGSELDEKVEKLREVVGESDD